jgi:hypothetical protein
VVGHDESGRKPTIDGREHRLSRARSNRSDLEKAITDF